MNKLSNNGVELIPLGPTEENTDRPLLKKKVFGDAFIVGRVQEYLETHLENPYVEIEEITKSLKSRYREYARRKTKDFKKMVEVAYHVVMNHYSINPPSSDNEAEVNEPEPEIIYTNSLNSNLLAMYSRNTTENEELIDISSDDNTEQNITNGKQKTNETTVKNNADGDINVQTKNLNDSGINNLDLISNDLKNSELASTSDSQRKRRLNVEEDNSIRKKKRTSMSTPKFVSQQIPNVSIKSFGGSAEEIKKLLKILVRVKNSKLCRYAGRQPLHGILIHGPPGCGKTFLAHIIANVLNCKLIEVNATELVSGLSGGTEQNIRELFEHAMQNSPAVIFIDEIDGVVQKKESASKEMGTRIVSQLAKSIDNLNKDESADKTIVVAATTKPEVIDPALRRAGRFEHEVKLGIPDIKAREQIMEISYPKHLLADDVDLKEIARLTPGFVGSDLMSLFCSSLDSTLNRHCEDLLAACNESRKKSDESDEIIDVINTGNSENNDIDVVQCNPETEETHNREKTDACIDKVKLLVRSNEDLEMLIREGKTELTNEQILNVRITMNDFVEGLKSIKPSANREGFFSVPDVTWDDVGSLTEIREVLQNNILLPIRYPEEFGKIKINQSKGVLLWGPPGCGKTLVAKAIAQEAGLNFISIKGPELLNMYVGESERAIRQCFQRARNSAPCIIFFDEIDALCSKRNNTGTNESNARVVAQLLTEMDGADSRKGVYLIAATNRPDLLDSALLRPGRLGVKLYVGLPTPDDRLDILKAIINDGKTGLTVSNDVDLKTIAFSPKRDGFSGADLKSLVEAAATKAISDVIFQQKTFVITAAHFEEACKQVGPSVTKKEQKRYEDLKNLLCDKTQE